MHQMTAGDQAYFVHRLPCRTRLKVPARRRDRAFFVSLRRRLVACSGVVSVTVSPEAASVVVHHSRDFQWSTVRFEALGLRAGEPSAKCTCTCQRCLHHHGAGEVEFASMFDWALRLALSGHPVAQLVEWAAFGIVRSALAELTSAETA